MAQNKTRPMTKPDIAEFLQVPIEDICTWAQARTFGDWLDACPEQTDRLHDENDVVMFRLISQLNNQIDRDIPFNERIGLITRGLCASRTAACIRQRRSIERARPETARWDVVARVCLRYDYEWLKPLRSSVGSIADFGCWASDSWATCSEPYALLWTLEATKVVVIDKEPEYIRNAQLWLETTRKRYPYFKDYNLEFVVGDMTDEALTETTDVLEEDTFDLSYCDNVLYNMYPRYNQKLWI